MAVFGPAAFRLAVSVRGKGLVRDGVSRGLLQAVHVVPAGAASRRAGARLAAGAVDGRVHGTPSDVHRPHAGGGNRAGRLRARVAPLVRRLHM
jgi:hypothetical protein